jgi:hypothetical protein
MSKKIGTGINHFTGQNGVSRLGLKKETYEIFYPELGVELTVMNIY